VDIDLFMKRSILLMKSGEVKTLTQNYLAFYPTPPTRLSFPGSILPGSLFSIFAFLDTTAGTSSLPLSTSLIFHRLKKIRPFLSTLTMSFNPLA
jgi:hypothetical protein